MIIPLEHLLPVKKNINSTRCYQTRSEPVGGILIHFDDSSNDTSGVEWFSDPACNVSYNRLYARDGTVSQITPTMTQAAWHAGVCKPSSPKFTYRFSNSFFYGLSAELNNTEVVRPAQFDAMVSDCVAIFKFHGWTTNDIWRISGHNKEAWPRGRKVDPEGTHTATPVLSVLNIQNAVMQKL